MQATRSEQNPTESDHLHNTPQQHPIMLRDKKVSDLIKDKKRLVEVPYTASLADTINALIANHVGAVPVAAPPGHWIGAGGSMILESDKQTGAVRKHYIGMVTMLDVLAHIAGPDDGNGNGDNVAKRMQDPVSSIIGHCLESLSLWTLSCHTSVLDCMEVFSKGIHRALVPIESLSENVSGVELMESASSYRMLTQMDVLKFLKGHETELKGIMSRQIKELGMSEIVFGVTDKIKVIDAIKCMNTAALGAVPIVEGIAGDDHSQLVNVKSRKPVATFSATDLRGCPISQLDTCLQMNIIDFIEKCSGTPLHEASGLKTSTRELITCFPETTLREVVNKSIDNHVHRVWLLDKEGLLYSVVALTDMIRVIRVCTLSEPL